MSENKGYDVVFYPHYEVSKTVPFGLPIYVIYKVKATTLLAKIK